ncbi:predicted protein [Arabidopsis lyrata subsp. lyrata]|uniref:Predicted protein n=1 Tax=Arabidopsis lyrata subsp. lyrata TaxID=81972 RepID=D7MPA8_ARALL|nr:predicted protein [Arabidopsis lyrata subsp. lyrata]
MRIVGLTGGISSGKSTVSNLFKASGIPVVDADVVARDVLKKGSSGWKRVVAAFGEEILLPSREVDRPKIGQIVFSSDSKRQLLIPKLLLCLSRYRLMAPYISSGIFWEILKQWVSGAKVIVVDIPLLFEVKMDKWPNLLWLLMERDGLSEEDARNRVMAQMLLDSKRSKADVVIDNNGSLDNLHQQFDNVLFEIRKPLTWIEFWRSRQGAFSVLGSVILGLSVCKQLKIGS